ncbi:LytTR family transcriptional regulator DNA-binding domain-containing protein [Paenibacillus gansuensis]|uniref:LytTR family transcriptional regulator DNA-binding domain-containing protein n=1 Tax=Paenibacillus gansuensis TaxID=306542 RepID=A0ABW5PDX0_9BACL
METLGNFLEHLRGSMSLREAAKRCGLSHVYIRDLEKNKSNAKNGDYIKPSPDTLKKLSEAYNYPYEHLMIKAGYIKEEQASLFNKPLVQMDLQDVCYIEVDDDYVTFHTLDKKYKNKIDSLAEFGEFLETLDDSGFIKTDRHLYANVYRVVEENEKDGLLYFDRDHKLYVTISLIKQKKYRNLITRSIAVNNDQTVELHIRPAKRSLIRVFSLD